MSSSEVRGTCHMVHLPIYRDGELLGRTYEQTTYPEWAFSAYRTGSSPDGPLPLGAGERAASCQDPMSVTKGLNPLSRTEQAMLDQASAATARLDVEQVLLADGRLAAEVRVENLAS